VNKVKTPEMFAEDVLAELEKHLMVVAPGHSGKLRAAVGDIIRAAQKVAVKENKVPAKTDAVWTAYRSAYQKRWGILPLDGPDTRAMMATFMRKVPASEAEDIVTFYVSHNDAFYVKAKHPFNLCLRDVVRLRTELQTGKVTTTKQAQAGESASGTRQSIQTYVQRKYAHGSK
jgi:hypothetical protein